MGGVLFFFFSDLANGYMMGTKDDMAIESWLFAFGIRIGRWEQVYLEVESVTERGRLAAIHGFNQEAFSMLTMLYPVVFTRDVSQSNTTRCSTAVCSWKKDVSSTCCCEMMLPRFVSIKHWLSQSSSCIDMFHVCVLENLTTLSFWNDTVAYLWLDLARGG